MTGSKLKNITIIITINLLPMETKIINETSKKMQKGTQGHLETIYDKIYKFDLLCLIKDEKRRLPYNVGRFKTVIGIFPYKDSPVFLYTKETELTVRLGADENKIPTIDFWKEMFAIKDALNTALTDLHLLPLAGNYFARKDSVSYKNWVVSFKEGFNTLKESCYANSHKAKIRYFGTFE